MSRRIVLQTINGDPSKAVIILVCQDQSPAGCLGAALSKPLFCAHNETMAIELLLYILPDYRQGGALLSLLRAYRYWARQVGASYISYASYKNGIEMNRIKRIK